MPRFYVTTPIYYVNDVPHVGHAYATVNADALARWHRLLGDDVFFLTGTDEHGVKVAQSAEEHGSDPPAWTERTSGRFVDAWKALEVSNDDFIRTSEPRHHRAVQAFLQRIYDNGFIETGTYSGWYCVGCEAYKDESELLEGHVCAEHHRPAQWLEEENYFFKLSAFQDRLVEWYESNPEAVRPEGKRNEALAFIKGGLHDISITRTSTRWGVEVPWDPAHVFYVWYDALVNYITAIGFGEDEARFEGWWPAVHHLIGKEILRFHCVWWPAMCMAAGIEPPAHVFVHGWLLVGGSRLSKTRIRQAAEAAEAAVGPAGDAGEGGGKPVKLTEITPAALTDDFGVDAIRYHLLRDTPLGTDGEFSYEGITARYNADLANNLGNLVSRVATVVGSKCGGVGPAPDAASRLGPESAAVVARAVAAWDRLAPHEALEATWHLIRETNAELEATEPWKADPGPVVDGVLGSALEALRIVAVLASPAMPGVCGEIWRRLGLPGRPDEVVVPEALAWGGYPGGMPVEKGAPLFPRRRA
ncbi:MAG: methionine--tRNA ligase [Acidobacteriota bacterium]|nr:methionine--tRNA ligase [Acidobacteriota bacterium]